MIKTIFLCFALSVSYAGEQAFFDTIEYYWERPPGDGPFPVMFLLNGYQPPEKNWGGKQLVKLGYLENFTNIGVVAVAISPPGYGNSEGERDFSGPVSQKAVANVIEHFATLPFIDNTRMGIYGISKGAILASMVHVYTPLLSLQILEAGSYDQTDRMALLPDYLSGIRDGLLLATGNTEQGFLDRSLLYHTDHIHGKTLILVGEYDDRRTVPSSIALHEKLLTEGKESTLKIYPNTLHCLTHEKWDAIIPFVREHFRHLYGIGIKVALWVEPAILIEKIHPNSPAARSGKLKVGDAILRISPMNDDQEIDTLRMPVPKFVSLILGPKGTPLRLHIQHFDYTYEDVILERG